MKSQRPHILFVSRWYPDRHDPMPGLFVRRHAEAVALFADVTVLYVISDKTVPVGKKSIDISEVNGIKEIRIYYGKSRFALLNGLFQIWHYLRALQNIKKPDITHVHVLTRTAIPALWLKLTSGIPYYITEHWSRYLPDNIAKGSYKGWWRRRITERIVKYASGVSTVTENLAKAMRMTGLHNKKYSVIPNVADTDFFKPSAEVKKGNTTRFVHVSCFDEPAKNIKGIIDAFQSLIETKPECVLYIVGDGPDYNAIFEYANRTGLVDSKIHFTGLLEGPLLLDQMQNADAMVMFSNYENLPCTIVESICCGVPVISSDVGGIGEHVKGANGLLVPKGDLDSLKNAMLKVAIQELNCEKLQLHNYGLQYFSMKSVALDFMKFYNLNNK